MCPAHLLWTCLCGALEMGPPTCPPRAQTCECACPRQTEASWDFVPEIQQEGRNVGLETSFWEQRPPLTRHLLCVFPALWDAVRMERGPEPGLGLRREPQPHRAPRPACSPHCDPGPHLLPGPGGGGGAAVYLVMWGDRRNRPCLGMGPQHPKGRVQACKSPEVLGHKGKLFCWGGHDTQPPKQHSHTLRGSVRILSRFCSPRRARAQGWGAPPGGGAQGAGSLSSHPMPVRGGPPALKVPVLGLG